MRLGARRRLARRVAGSGAGDEGGHGEGDEKEPGRAISAMVSAPGHGVLSPVHRANSEASASSRGTHPSLQELQESTSNRKVSPISGTAMDRARQPGMTSPNEHPAAPLPQSHADRVRRHGRDLQGRGRGPGRTVAIKVLAERYARDESLRSRFTREALTAARLSASRTRSRSSTSASGATGRSSSWSTSTAARSRTGFAREGLSRRTRRSPGSTRRLLRSTPPTATASSTATSSRGTSSSTSNDELRVADFGIASAAGLASLT